MTLLLPITRVVGIIFEFCLKNWPISKKEWRPSEVNFWSYGKKRVLSIFSIETLIRMQVWCPTLWMNRTTNSWKLCLERLHKFLRIMNEWNLGRRTESFLKMYCMMNVDTVNNLQTYTSHLISTTGYTRKRRARMRFYAKYWVHTKMLKWAS